MTGRKSIDLTSAVRQYSLEFRLVKITTESDEIAAPYESKGAVYRSRWSDESTDRAADLTDADILTSFFTTEDMWILAVRTPFGHWEGIAEYQQD